MLKWVALVLLVTLAFGWAHCAQKACTYKASNGDFYDLSRLARFGRNGFWKISENVSSGVFHYYINFCRNSSGAPVECQTASPVCQTQSWSNVSHACGTLPAIFSDLPQKYGKEGVTIQYKNGEGYGCPGARYSIIHVVCDPSTKGKFIDFGEVYPLSCNYTGVFHSKFACRHCHSSLC